MRIREEARSEYRSYIPLPKGNLATTFEE